MAGWMRRAGQTELVLLHPAEGAAGADEDMATTGVAGNTPTSSNGSKPKLGKPARNWAMR